MKRREFIIAAALLAASCAAPIPTAPAAFESDRIQVTARGSGPDVVLIPGLSSSPEVWESTVAAVPGYRYHLVQVNGFAGHPPAGNAGEGPLVPLLAEEIARYVRESGLERPALIGHSMGGALGMMVAARHPDLVSRLMVVDMMPFIGAMFGPPGTTAETVRPIADQVRDTMLQSEGDARKQMLTARIASMIKTESLRARPTEHALASDPGVSARAMHDLIVTDLRPELANIRVPVTVLYVRAPNAPISDAQMDAYYKQSYGNVPQVTLKRVPDAWHFIMFDQPERFFEEVRSFLATR
jgi:pimeloyl-ACP methyl ester carboxylesterase